MADEELLATFYEETRENLETAEEGLLELEKDPANSALVDTVFRAMHTIKGGSGLVNADAVQEIAHSLENILDELRSQAVKVEQDVFSLLLRGTELINKLMDQEALNLEGNPFAEEIEQIKQECAAKDVTGEASGSAGEVDATEGTITEKAAQAGGEVAEQSETKNYYLVQMKFAPEIFETGTDPLMFFMELEEKGNVLCTFINDENLPDVADLDPQKLYISWSIFLQSDATSQEIDDIFIFVKDENEIAIEDISDQLADWFSGSSKTRELFEQYQIVGENYLVQAVAKQAKIWQSLDTASPSALSSQSTEKGAAEAKDVDQAAEAADAGVPEAPEAEPSKQEGEQQTTASAQPQKEAAAKSGSSGSSGSGSSSIGVTDTVRVSSSKLEGILNYIAELLIAQSRVKELVAQISEESDGLYDEIVNSFQQVDKIIRQVQDEVMEASMVPIGSTFIRFQKMARDLAKEKQKEVVVNISGKETELDKKVIEEITDPLKHLIRNSLDHGVETPEEREEKGKPRQGTINISAFHQEGNIVIEISDDGRGLDQDKILEKAIERGLISSDQELSHREINNLLFLPGFSTSSEVTDISGRGVGLDVVKSNIKNLRGNIALYSEKDKGTRFVIKLPLTLAIIDGMMIRVGEERFIVPMTFISEFIDPQKQEFSKAEGRSIILNLRDEYIPYVRLDQMINIESDSQTQTNHHGIALILKNEQRKMALHVDEIVKQEQVVIKSVKENMGNIEGVAGVTILGDGKVSLILDVPSLFNLARRFKGVKFSGKNNNMVF